MAEVQKNRQPNRKPYRRDPSGRSIAAFILGIASIVLCVLPIMLVAAVVGLSLERDSELDGFHKLQYPARILNIIGIVLCSAVIVLILILIFVVGILAR